MTQRQLNCTPFLARLDPAPGDSAIDVGVSRDRRLDGSDYREGWYPDKSRLTAAGIDDASLLATEHRWLSSDGSCPYLAPLTPPDMPLECSGQAPSGTARVCWLWLIETCSKPLVALADCGVLPHEIRAGGARAAGYCRRAAREFRLSCRRKLGLLPFRETHPARIIECLSR